jgi:hypothetical protein
MYNTHGAGWRARGADPCPVSFALETDSGPRANLVSRNHLPNFPAFAPRSFPTSTCSARRSSLHRPIHQYIVDRVQITGPAEHFRVLSHMLKPTSSSNRANDQGKSWLFYTPPPEEMKDCYDGMIEGGCYATTSSEFLKAQHTQLTKKQPKLTRNIRQFSKTSLASDIDRRLQPVCDKFTGTALNSRDSLRITSERSRFPDCQEQLRREEHIDALTMDRANATLTVPVELSKERTNLVHPHLSDGEIGKSHLPKSSSIGPSISSTLPESRKSIRDQTLTGRPSEGSNIEKGTSKSTLSSLVNHTGRKIAKDKRRVRKKDQSSPAGTMKEPSSITVKRRAASSVTQRKNVKRPKLLGPFIDDSNSDSDTESDSEGGSGSSDTFDSQKNDSDYDIDNEDDCDAKPAARLPELFSLDVRKATSRPALPPSKVVNRDRLRKLIGQKQYGNKPVGSISNAGPANVQTASATSPIVPHGQVQSAARADQDIASAFSDDLHTTAPPSGLVMGSDTVFSGSTAQLTANVESNALLQSSTKTNTMPPPAISTLPSTSGSSKNATGALGPSQAKDASAPVRHPLSNPRLLKAVGAKSKAPSNTAVKKSNRQTSASKSLAQGGAGVISGSGIVGCLIQGIRQSGQPGGLATNRKPGSIWPHGSKSVNDRRDQGQVPGFETTSGGQPGQNRQNGPSTEPSHQQSPALHRSRVGSTNVATDGLEIESKQGRKGNKTSHQAGRTPSAPNVPKSQASNKPTTGQKRKVDGIERIDDEHPLAKRPATTLMQARPPAQSVVETQSNPKPSGFSHILSESKASTMGDRLQKALTATTKTCISNIKLQISGSTAATQKTASTSSSTPNLSQKLKPQVQVPHALPVAEEKLGSSPVVSVNGTTGGQPRNAPTNAVVVRKTAESKNTAVKEAPTDATTAQKVTKAPQNAAMMLQPTSDRNLLDVKGTDLPTPASVQSAPKIRMKTYQSPTQASITEHSDRNTLITQPGTDGTTKGQRFSAAGMAGAKAATTTPRISKQQDVLPVRKSISSITTSSSSRVAIDGMSRTSEIPSRSNGSEHGSPVNILNNKVLPVEQQTEQRGNKKFPVTVDSNVPTSNVGGQSSVVTEPPKATSKLAAEPVPVQHTAKNPEPEIPSLTTTTISRVPRSDSPQQAATHAPVLSSLPTLSADVEPHFEYSVFQKIWSASEDESSVTAVEISLHPSTNISEANRHAEKLFCNAREQYQQHFAIQFSEWKNTRNDNGCNVLGGTFAPVDYPEEKSWMKLWVQRAQISAHAGNTMQAMAHHTSFVAKTVYVLRLFQILSTTPDSDTEDTAAVDKVKRIFYPLPRTECYTTLYAANRAAYKLQIDLSHKSNPSALDNIWQKKNVAELNRKLKELEEAEDGGDKYWKSEFNGSGLGSVTFELLVEKVGLCGPRNL